MWVQVPMKKETDIEALELKVQAAVTRPTWVWGPSLGHLEEYCVLLMKDILPDLTQILRKSDLYIKKNCM